MSNNLTRFSKSKTGAIAIVLFLMFSISASMILMPAVKAQTPGETIPTFAYISVSPNPVGTGQSVEVIIWLNQVIFNAAIPNNIRFHNYQLVITAPNGDKQTQAFPIVFDSTSAQDFQFVPTQVGTYTLNFTFPGQTYNFPITFTMFGSNAPYEGDYYAPSTASTTLTVQASPISYYPGTPLPTSYWTRPIYAYNTNWIAVSSNWLGTGAPGYGGFASTYNAGGNGEQLNGAGDVVGSMTSHVMWTKPLDSGGIVGGNQTSVVGDTYFEGSAYNQRYTNPIIVDGMLYYTEPISFAGVPGGLSGSAYGPTDCVNLQTGQLIWSRSDVPALSFAYIYDVQDPNQHGVYQPILFAASGGASLFGVFPLVWQAYDAFTGDPMFNITNVPVGTSFLGANGEELVLSLVNLGTTAKPNYYLQEWNSSRLWDDDYSGESTSPPVIPPITNGADPSLLDFNVSVTGVPAGPVTQVGAILDDRLLCYSGNLPSTGAIFMGSQSDTPYTYFAISISQSHKSVGTILWHQTYNPPPSNITVLEAGIDPVNRVFVENWRETSQYVGYSLDTGQKIWGPTTPQADLDYYGSPASGSLANAFAYGMMYSSAYAGIVYCYDTKTGNIVWTYGNGGSGNSTNSGLETPFAHYPTFVNAIGNDVVYLVTTEHTPETPLFKGGLARAVNATTGKELWTISSYTGEFQVFSYAAADGYNTWFNGYDNQIYVVGRGPSRTTVTAPNNGLASGQTVVIRGTVTDLSAGTTQNEQAANFPNGVPVCSDASMQAWMGYVYQQQPAPSNFTGVPVTISVTDSNHNTRTIGMAMTNANGMYTLTWTPDISGNYTVSANFAGTNGYWPSYDTTSFSVMQASATAPPTVTPATNLASNGTVEYGIVAIIIVIIVIGAVLALLVTRKHP
ncbi:MAG: PQQ-binding-like beta-propeller repeat protein [Candidatus Bathyarchaeia archaeon]